MYLLLLLLLLLLLFCTGGNYSSTQYILLGPYKEFHARQEVEEEEFSPTHPLGQVGGGGGSSDSSTCRLSTVREGRVTRLSLAGGWWRETLRWGGLLFLLLITCSCCS